MKHRPSFRTLLSGLLLAALPAASRADSVSDAASALKTAIGTYVADPSPANSLALEAAQAAFNTASAENATTTYSEDFTVPARQVLTTPTVLFVDSGVTLTYDHLTLSGNGGAVSIGSGGSLFLGSGGADLSDGGDSSATGFSANSATNGGALLNTSTATTAFTDAAFSGNSASDSGGAIYSAGTLTFTESAFSNNSALYGGAIENYGGAVTASDSVFSGNSGASGGGAIDNFNAGTVTVARSTFTNNTSTNYDGGAIYNSQGGVVNVTDSTFTGNSAKVAGAIENSYSTLTILDSTFEGNTAITNAGGAIYSAGSTSILTITGSRFANNTASSGYYGGAIYGYQGAMTITDTVFEGNTAGWGGAVENYLATLTLTDGTFTGNTASISGGAIDNSSGTITITRAGFAENSAVEWGGAIENDSGNVAITDASFTKNSAVRGGAVENYEGTLTLTDTTFQNNTATGFGGAISNDGGTVNLVVSAGATSLFSGNTAAGAASSIYTEDYGTLAIAVGDDGVLDMRDPLSGSADSASIQIGKTGVGVWKLGGANTFASTGSATLLTVTEGALYLYAAGEVENDAASTPDEETVAAGSISLAGSTSSFTLANGATLIAGGANSIQTDGSIHLNGGATIRGGTATDNATAPEQDGITSSLTLTAGANIALEGELTVAAIEAGDTFTLDALLADGSAAGSLVKTGAGAVVLAHDSTFTGGLAIEDGILRLSDSGSVLADTLPVTLESGTFALGASPETIGSLTATGGTLAFGLSNSGSYGVLAIDGALTLTGGTLSLTLLGGYTPAAGDSFDLLDWGSLTGTFAALDLPDGITWDTSSLYTDGTISVVAVPEPSLHALVILALLSLILLRRRKTSMAVRRAPPANEQ